MLVEWARGQRPKDTDRVAHTERIIREAIDEHLDFSPSKALILYVIISSNHAVTSVWVDRFLRGCAHGAANDLVHITVRFKKITGTDITCHVYLHPARKALTENTHVWRVTFFGRHGVSVLSRPSQPSLGPLG